MKRFLILALCVLMAFFCIACANNKHLQNTDNAASTTDTNAGLPQFGDLADQKQMAVVSMPLIRHSETASNGKEIFNHVYQDISLILPDPEVADKIVIDFLNRTDAYGQNADLILKSAKDAYETNSLTTPYLCQITYEPTRIDYSVLSLQGKYITYSGSAHPEIAYLSVNYDVSTGNVLSLTDIITGPEEFDNLCKTVIGLLNDRKEDLQLYEGFESTVRDLFKNGVQNIDFWYLTPKGLCLYFSPYEIAPYAAGMITAEIPYSQLVGILDNAYFPPEQASGSAELNISKFDEKVLDKFTQFAEISTSQSNEKYLLYTNKPVYNLRLQVGTALENDEGFGTEHVVFAAYALTPGDAIVITTNQNETLRLSYEAGEQNEVRYISITNDSPALLKP